MCGKQPKGKLKKKPGKTLSCFKIHDEFGIKTPYNQTIDIVYLGGHLKVY